MEAPRSGGLNSVCASLLDIHGTEDCREWIHRFGRQPCTACMKIRLSVGRMEATVGRQVHPIDEARVIACEKCHHTPESLMNCPTKPAAIVLIFDAGSPLSAATASCE